MFLLYGFLQTETGQNWLARQVTKRLSKDLQTKISIKHVKLNLFNFNRMDLEGVLMEDQKHDTLLYAGLFQVRITDWFVFKEKADLEYIGLENAIINLNRTDSVWNYAFLDKYFSSGTTADTTSKKKAGIAFDLKKVVMKNVSFVQKDAWTGSDMYVKVGGLDMDARKITISNQTVDVSNLVLEDPYFSLFAYQGKQGPALASPKSEKTVKEESQPGWTIRFGNISIHNGRFRDDQGTRTASLPYFDGEHIDFSKINGTLKNIGFTKDTVTGTINLSTQERSGLVVKSLKAKTTIHPKAMIFDDLYLETNHSVITNYYSMRYKSIDALDNFIHDVTLEGRFTKATISSDDIAFFAPDLKTWKRNIKIDGDIKGTVDALSSKDLEIWAGNNTYIHGGVSLVGLPNIDETLINIDAQDLHTTYSDAANLVPSIRSITTPDLKKLSYLRFKGTYTGFISDFVTFGTIQTNLGTLQTDLNMKFPKNGDPVYAGKISTEGFQLGQFIGSDYLGSVSFHGSVKGKGFEWQRLNMNVDGVVNRIQYGDYTYTNITAKGSLTNRLFNGDFTMKDPNADLHLNGVVDLSRKVPLFKATADIAHADLKALGLTNQDFQLQGKFDLDLQASSLSDLIGTARISEASLSSNGKRLEFDSLVVHSDYESGLKKLTAISNQFDASITGDFNLQDLPNAFTVFLHRYYPSYIKAPKSVKPQIFAFDITTGAVEEYMKLIDPNIAGFNNSHIKGSLNTTANTMTVDADVPFAQYRQYQFSDVSLKGSGDLQKLTLTGELGDVQIGDSLMFPQTSFTVTAQNDISDVTINTSSNQAINKANVSAQVRTFTDGVSILLHPSSFVLNGKTWTIEEGGELNLRRNSVVHGGVTLKESNQEIRLWTEPDALGNWNNLKASFQNVNIGDISPFLTKSSRIEGLLNGEATVEDPQKRFDVNSNLTISGLRLDNDSIGDVRAALVYDNKTGSLSVKASNSDIEHHVDVNVAMNLKDSLTNLHIRSQLTNFQLNLLNRFLAGIFSDIKGFVTGNLDVDIGSDGTNVVSKAKIHDASFKVDFTQVTYKIDDTEVELKKDFIDLNNMRIRDKDGNTAIVKGGIKHNAFSNMNYDISVETQSKNFELLSTTINDNQTFFGTARGSGSFTLVGPENDLLMDVDMKASDVTPSYITMPPSRSRESGDANFMVERKYGKEMSSEASETASNLSYRIHL
ncbi:MAG: translocation/assembly module TamB domain-containing protein, partial [Flavisolibacter sp.]